MEIGDLPSACSTDDSLAYVIIDPPVGEKS